MVVFLGLGTWPNFVVPKFFLVVGEAWQLGKQLYNKAKKKRKEKTTVKTSHCV